MSHPVSTHDPSNVYPSDHYKPSHHKPKVKALKKAKGEGSLGQSVSKLKALLASKPHDFLGR